MKTIKAESISSYNDLLGKLPQLYGIKYSSFLRHNKGLGTYSQS